MKKQISKVLSIAIVLFVFQVIQPSLKAQPIGSILQIGTNSSISYWNGSTFVVMTPGVPGQSLQFVNGVPAWISNPQGIVTTVVYNVLSNTATSGGTILSDGGTPITERGVCWSTSHNPTISNAHRADTIGGVGNFTINLTALTSAKNYFVRAYATYSMGTVYGNEVSFSTLSDLSTVTDYDGNGYETVVIGTQTWMKQDLKVTHYRNGDPIPNVADSAAWINLTTGAYCYYGNDSNVIPTYGVGRIYNFYAVTDPRNLCPTSWHVSSDDEWTTLSNYLGGASIAGYKLKQTDWHLVYISHLIEQSNNESGFSAEGGGCRGSNGRFDAGGPTQDGFWWTSTLYNGTNTSGWVRTMDFTSTALTRGWEGAREGMYVRCVKDTVKQTIPAIIDIDGNVYDSDTIGTQIWMKQNLKATHYRNGDAIPNVTDATAWANLTTGAYSNYNNDTNDCAIYGRLYNWYTVADARNLCPTGWHAPNDDEWTTLFNYLGGLSVAGGKLKGIGTNYWYGSNVGATNTTGFSAYGGGSRYYSDGSFIDLTQVSKWWSSNKYSDVNGWAVQLAYNTASAYRGNYDIGYGMYMRCLKDTFVAPVIHPVYDFDGNGYDTVRIGTQTWMKQDLKVTHYINGDTIPNVTDNTTWSNLTSGAYCNYNNDTTIATTYGRIYNYYTVANSHNLCPSGYHIPSDAEWTTLTDYLGGLSVAGKLKETGTSHWYQANSGATNESGFTALGSGYRSGSNGSFNQLESYTLMWSSTLNTNSSAWFREILFNTGTISRSSNSKDFGYSVRCLKDQ